MVLGKSKKILVVGIKLAIGILSFYIIYTKLVSIPHLKEQCTNWFRQPSVYPVLALVVVLMPVNWGIESYKWKLITRQIQRVSYQTALKSVFSGICLGNIAPGRSMEFLAKIVFFKTENRPSITILHFMNGMFQLLITVMVGIISVSYKFNQTHGEPILLYGIVAGGVAIFAFCVWAITHMPFIQQKMKWIKWFRGMDKVEPICFSAQLVFVLVGLSAIRYLVFTTQFYLIYKVLFPGALFWESFTSIAAYFMLTSIIPMVSYIEPAIRAAIALFVFNGVKDNTVFVILASTCVWIINVVIPSIIGYLIIVREKLEFGIKHAG